MMEQLTREDRRPSPDAPLPDPYRTASPPGHALCSDCLYCDVEPDEQQTAVCFHPRLIQLDTVTGWSTSPCAQHNRNGQCQHFLRTMPKHRILEIVAKSVENDQKQQIPGSNRQKSGNFE
jgi:alpha-D-ribose 1-methylphosphonate 5-triphosphate synthase subunit PhnL